MNEKVKLVFKTIGSIFATVFGALGVLFFCKRRSETDRRRSDGNAERDARIQKGIGDCSDGVSRAESHIDRAESILREAIDRSKQEK